MCGRYGTIADTNTRNGIHQFGWPLKKESSHEFASRQALAAVTGNASVVYPLSGASQVHDRRFWRPGSWGLPSGYANRNETLENTLRREVREETGLEIEVTRYLRMVSGFRLRLEVSFLGKLCGGTIQLDPKEVIDAQFFAKDALPEGLLRSHREIIELAFSANDPSLGD